MASNSEFSNNLKKGTNSKYEGLICCLLSLLSRNRAF
jgi:hypothetical protein